MRALCANNTGRNGVAVGYKALGCANSFQNTAIGYAAGYPLTTNITREILSSDSQFVYGKITLTY
jgi:hypothetical protein